MRLQRLISYSVIVFLLPIFSCEKTIIEQVTGPNGNGKLYSIEGHAQKGPFVVGSNVTVAELTQELYPTGRVFFSTILDDEGYFELPGVVLESPYIQIKIEGYYFSEVDGGVNDANGTSTLYSIADIREGSTMNVNILTHLEKERVEFLVQHDGKSFNEAKKQALNEILKVFELEDNALENSEDLIIFSDGVGNGILLAVASIVEASGFSYFERLELITTFQKDLEDGKLDSEDIQAALYNTAVYKLKPDLVVNNLTENFPDRVIPDFVPYLNLFIENSSFINYFKDVFPALPVGTINLLQDTTIKIIDPSKSYVLAFKVPKGVNAHIGLTIEGRSQPGMGAIDANSEFWLATNLYECPQPTPDFCETQQSYWADVSGNNMEDIYIPVSFTGHGISYYYFWIEVEGYVWGRIEKANLKW